MSGHAVGFSPERKRTGRRKVDGRLLEAFETALRFREYDAKLVELHGDVPVAGLGEPVGVQAREVEPHAGDDFDQDEVAELTTEERSHLRSPRKKHWSNRSVSGLADKSRPLKSSTFSSSRIFLTFALRISSPLQSGRHCGYQPAQVGNERSVGREMRRDEEQARACEGQRDADATLVSESSADQSRRNSVLRRSYIAYRQ